MSDQVPDDQKTLQRIRDYVKTERDRQHYKNKRGNAQTIIYDLCLILDGEPTSEERRKSRRVVHSPDETI